MPTNEQPPQRTVCGDHAEIDSCLRNLLKGGKYGTFLFHHRGDIIHLCLSCLQRSALCRLISCLVNMEIFDIALFLSRFQACRKNFLVSRILGRRCLCRDSTWHNLVEHWNITGIGKMRYLGCHCEMNKGIGEIRDNFNSRWRIPLHGQISSHLKMKVVNKHDYTNFYPWRSDNADSITTGFLQYSRNPSW